LLGEADRVREYAEAAVALSTEQGFPYWIAQASVMLGWVRTEAGDLDGGIRQIREGIADCRLNSAELGCTFLMAQLTDALIRAGLFDEAQAAVSEALSLAQSNGERYFEAELHRLSGVLRLDRAAKEGETAPLAVSTMDEAEGSFARAIALSSQQGARMLELRAAMAQARLWQREGKTGAARQQLEAVYQRFTEGLDSADLQAAKALLDTQA